MSIEQTNVVDFVAVDSETGRLVLTISDHLEWPEDAALHLSLLQEKLNSYLRFVESGEVLECHPKAAGRTILIDLVLQYPASEQAVKFFVQVKEIVEGAGFEFRYRVFQP